MNTLSRYWSCQRMTTIFPMGLWMLAIVRPLLRLSPLHMCLFLVMAWLRSLNGHWGLHDKSPQYKCRLIVVGWKWYIHCGRRGEASSSSSFTWFNIQMLLLYSHFHAFAIRFLDNFVTIPLRSIGFLVYFEISHFLYQKLTSLNVK